MSEAALEALGGGPFDASGFPWMEPGETRGLSIKALASRGLCQRHNEALSKIDAQGGRFVSTIRAIDAALGSDCPTDAFFLFNGHDIERWLLKTLCGVLASGNAAVDATKIVWQPEDEWNQVLFAGRELGHRCGLYFCADAEPIYTGDHIGVSPLTLTAPDGRLVVTGALIEIAGFSFALAMAGKMKDVASKRRSFTRVAYRPSRLVFGRGPSSQVVHLHWDGDADREVVPLNHVGRK